MKLSQNRHYAYREFRNINNIILYYESLANEVSKFTIRDVTPGIAYKYQGHFYGLLKHLNVDPSLYLPSLYLNGLTSPYDYDGKQISIKIAGPINFPRQ